MFLAPESWVSLSLPRETKEDIKQQSKIPLADYFRLPDIECLSERQTKVAETKFDKVFSILFPERKHGTDNQTKGKQDFSGDVRGERVRDPAGDVIHR